MLLADRTSEHQEFYREGFEAEYFASEAELLSKLKFYSANEPARQRIADAGMQRGIRARYAYIHRMKAALDRVARIT
jgi:spore maturation protein CgeB